MYYRVRGNSLDCYEWEEGNLLLISDEVDESQPDKLYSALNISKQERAMVLLWQIEKAPGVEAKVVSFWDKLRAQISNLEQMYDHHLKGADMAVPIYWTVEVINEIIKKLEEETGANKERMFYDEK